MDMFEEKDIFTEYPKTPQPSKKKTALVVTVCAIIVVIVAGIAFFGGTMYGREKSIDENMPMVKTILDALDRYYIDEIDWDEFQFIVAAAVAGSVDPYTGLVATSPAGMQTLAMGITFGNDEYCNYKITDIAPGSPASKAYNVYSDGQTGSVQLKIGDELLSIDGYPVQHLNRDSFSQIISKTGETVELSVVRNEGSTPLFYNFSITKEMFHSPVAYYLDSDITGLPSNVGYIVLKEFGDTACDDFAEAVDDFLNDTDKPDKLVLDLRGNGGGSTAICGFIASYFVKQNGKTSGIPMAKYVYNAGYGDMEETYFYTQNTYESDVDGTMLQSFNLYDRIDGFDCVVLVNGSSASSSELLTSTLSYYCGVKSVGSKTYGKGVAQIVIPYNNAKYELYMTNGRYYIASEKNGETVFETNIHGVGLTPDIPADASGMYYMAQDPCLLEAADYLTA